MKKRFKKQVISAVSIIASIIALGLRNQFRESGSLINDIKIILSKLANLSIEETLLFGTLILATGMIVMPITLCVIVKRMEKNSAKTYNKTNEEEINYNNQNRKNNVIKVDKEYFVEHSNNSTFNNNIDEKPKTKVLTLKRNIRDNY